MRHQHHRDYLLEESREGGSTFRGLETQRLAVEVAGGGGHGSRITKFEPT